LAAVSVFASISTAPAAPSARAQDAPGAVVRLTLGACLEKARAHSARLAQLAALEDAARSGLDGARADRLPQIDVSAGYTRLSDVPELSLALPGSTTRQTVFPNIPDTYRARAGLTLPLYTGGRVPGRIAAAGHQQEAAGRDLEAGVRDLVLETTAAYWSLVTSGETARVVDESLRSFEAHLKDAQDRYDFGLAARSDVLAVQVERDRAELHGLQARNALAVANEDLLRLVGLPPGTTVEPVAEPAENAAPAPEAEALVTAALAGRPDLLALRARAAAAEAAVGVARSPVRPQVGLAAGFDYARPNTRVLPLVDDWKDSWSVGVNVSMAPFDGGRSSAAAAQARAQAKALRHQVEDLERRVRLEVKSRTLDVASAGAAVRVADRALEAAREAARVERDRYQEGVSSSADRLDAETRLLRAGVDRTNAAAALSLAHARLERAVGR
jgi:outer membrane protein TolC